MYKHTKQLRQWRKILDDLEKGIYPKNFDDLSLAWNTCAVGEKLGKGPRHKPDLYANPPEDEDLVGLGCTFYASLPKNIAEARFILEEIENHIIVNREKSTE